MKIPKLSEDYKSAKQQWAASWNLINAQTQQISHFRKRVAELEKELKLLDKTEVDSLRSLIEVLTNELEELR